MTLGLNLARVTVSGKMQHGQLLTGDSLDRKDAVAIFCPFDFLGVLTGVLTRQMCRVSARAGWGLPQGRGSRAVGPSPRAVGWLHAR